MCINMSNQIFLEDAFHKFMSIAVIGLQPIIKVQLSCLSTVCPQQFKSYPQLIHS